MCDVDVEGAKSKMGNVIFETNFFFFAYFFFEFLVFVAIAGKISSSSSYRCGQGHRGLGFRGKSRPGVPLAEAQGRGFSWQSETIPSVQS